MRDSIQQGELSRLLAEWDDARLRGEDARPEEICAQCPELLEPLELEIKKLKDWDGLLARTPESMATNELAPEGPVGNFDSVARFVVQLSELKPHARGGLGIVCKAWHDDLRRFVAVKFLQPKYAKDLEARARFLREAEITAGLEHPGIVPIYGIGQDRAGIPFYVMQFIEGRTLQRAARQFHETSWASLKPGELNKAFRDLLLQFLAACEAVAHAHGRGVLHRDLKPGNIILGPLGRVLVLDWGLAKVVSARSAENQSAGIRDPLTAGSTEFPTCARMGTAGYMSSEQQSGDWEKVDARSDVFSLGVTLYAIICGTEPFSGTTAAEIFTQVERGEPTPPRKHNPAIPRALEQVCLKAMSRERKGRYPTARELVEDVKSFLAGEPVSAWREPLTDRLARGVMRHRKSAGIIAASFLGVAVMAVIAGFMFQRASGIEDMRRADAARHVERLREEGARLAVRDNDLAYVNAEKTATEEIRQKRVGWVKRSTSFIGDAASIPTALRNVAALRTLAISARAGFDLEERVCLTSMNSACVAFSADGKLLAVGEHHLESGRTFRVQVFDARLNTMVRELPIDGNPNRTKRTGVSAIAFSPDGRWLAAGLRNGNIWIWDMHSPSLAAANLGGHKEQVRGLCFDPDSSALVSGAADKTVSIWVRSEGWKHSSSFDVGDQLSDLDLGTDGKLLAVASDFSRRSYDFRRLRSGDRSSSLIGARKQDAQRVAVSPDHQTVAFSDFHHRIHVTDVRADLDRMFLDPDQGASHRTDICRLDFHPGGSFLVSGSCDNTVKAWDLAADRLSFAMSSVSDAVVVPAFSPNGKLLAVATSEGTRLYDVLGFDFMTSAGLQGREVRDFAFVNKTAVGGPVLAITTLDNFGGVKIVGRVSFWDPTGVAPIQNRDFQAPSKGLDLALSLEPHPIDPAVVHNSALRVSVVHSDGRLLAEVPELKSSWLRFAPDGSLLWGIIDDEQVASWSMPQLSARSRWKLGNTDKLRGRVGLSCLAAGSRWVAAGSRAARVYVIRSADSRFERELIAGAEIVSIAISPDESMIVCGLIDGKTQVFSLPEGKPLGELAAHGDAVNSVAFSPDGLLVASASRDKTVAIWQVGGPMSLTELFRIPSPSGKSVLRVKFSPDGRMLGMLVRNERAVRLIRLDALRSRFRELGLDWESSTELGKL